MSLATSDSGGLVTRDPQSVLDFLDNVNWMLDAALELRGSADVALIKAQVVMAETYAKELQLSKENRDKAAEMVRRSEWSLEQAIQRDKAEGLLKTERDGGGVYGGVRGSSPRSASDEGDPKGSAKDFFGSSSERSAVFQMGQATRDEFEAALDAAKEEGNLSRANVVRKINQSSVKSNTAPATHSRGARAEIIRDLAAQGYSSRQMPNRVGVSEETVRQIARDFDIEIPADKVVGRTRRIDHTDAMDRTVTALDDWASALTFIDFAEVDFSEAGEWVSSLTNSLTELRRFIKQIKEQTHV